MAESESPKSASDLGTEPGDRAADGSWDEPEFTGTGFPKVFYLRYHYYPIYFPLMALARWCSAQGAVAVPAAAVRECVA